MKHIISLKIGYRKGWIVYRMRAYLQIFRGQESYSKWQYMISQIVKINAAGV